MKIVHLVWSLKLGGSETMLVNIANEQCKTERVTIIIINEFYNKKLLESISKMYGLYYCIDKCKLVRYFQL